MYGQEPGKKPPATPLPNDDREVDLDEWDRIVAEKYKVPHSLMRAISSQESGGNVNAVSPTKVRGKYQVTERTAKSYGLDRNDPFQQSVAAAKHLRNLYDSTPGNDDDERWLGASAKYYGGDDAVRNGEVSNGSLDGLSNPARYAESIAKKWGELRRAERGQQPTAQPAQPDYQTRTYPKQYMGSETDPAKQKADKANWSRPFSTNFDINEVGPGSTTDNPPKITPVPRAPRQPSTQVRNVFNKNLEQDQRAAAQQARTALDFRPAGGNVARLEEQSKGVTRRVIASPQDAQRMAAREQYQQLSPTQRLATRVAARLGGASTQQISEVARPMEGSIEQAAQSLPNMAIRGAGELARAVPSLVRNPYMPTLPNQGLKPVMRQISRGADRAADVLVPENPDDQSWITGKIPRAIGSTLPMMAATVGSGGAAGVPVIAGMMGGLGQYDRAVEQSGRTLTPGQQASGELLAMGTGALEGLGVGRALQKLGVTQAVKQRAAQILEEAGTEGLQQFFDNVNAAYVSSYDPSRRISNDPNKDFSDRIAPLLQGVGESALLGGIIGTGVAAPSIPGDVRAQREARVGAQQVAREPQRPMNLTPTAVGPTERVKVTPGDFQRANLETQKGFTEPLTEPLAPPQVAPTAPIAPAADAAPAAAGMPNRADFEPGWYGDMEYQGALADAQRAQKAAPPAKAAAAKPAYDPTAFRGAIDDAKIQAGEAEAAGNWEAARDQYRSAMDTITEMQKEARRNRDAAALSELAREKSATNTNWQVAKRNAERAARQQASAPQVLPAQQVKAPVLPTGDQSAIRNPQSAIENAPTRGLSAPLPASAEPAPQSRPEVAAPVASKPARGLQRNFRAGMNDGSMVFESETQRDLYDLAAAEKYRTQNKPNDRAVRDVGPLYRDLMARTGLSREEIQNRAYDTYDDVRGQMKGVKHLEERRLIDNLKSKPQPVEDVRTSSNNLQVLQNQQEIASKPFENPASSNASLTPQTNRITEGAGDELPRRVSRPLEGQPAEVPTRFTEYEGGEMQRYSKPLEGQPVEVPEKGLRTTQPEAAPSEQAMTDYREYVTSKTAESKTQRDPRYTDKRLAQFEDDLGGHPERFNPNVYVPGKSGWEVTRKKWVELQPEPYQDRASAGHRVAVERAIAEGKPVPPEVLANYPDLAPKQPEKPAPQYSPAEAALREREALPPIERRRALRDAVPRGQFGKLSEAAYFGAPRNESLAGNAQLRRLLDLPEMPPYRLPDAPINPKTGEPYTNPAWAEAAQDTLNALAALAGKERSSQINFGAGELSGGQQPSLAGKINPQTGKPYVYDIRPAGKPTRGEYGDLVRSIRELARQKREQIDPSLDAALKDTARSARTAQEGYQGFVVDERVDNIRNSLNELQRDGKLSRAELKDHKTAWREVATEYGISGSQADKLFDGAKAEAATRAERRRAAQPAIANQGEGEGRSRRVVGAVEQRATGTDGRSAEGGGRAAVPAKIVEESVQKSAIKQGMEQAESVVSQPRRRPVKDIVAEADARMKARKESIDTFLRDKGETELQVPYDGGRDGRFVIVHKTTKPGHEGKWQASFMDNDGPVRDSVSADYRQLLDDLVKFEKVDLSKAQTAQKPAAPEAKEPTKKPWEVTKETYERAVMPPNKLSPEEAKALEHIRDVRRNWKEPADDKGRRQIFPSRKDVNTDPKIWRALAKKGYVEDRGFGADVTFTGTNALRIAQGENPWLGVTIKTHKALVEKAIAEGKPVPPEVLADYPDLQPPAAKPAPTFDTLAQKTTEGPAANLSRQEWGQVKHDPNTGLYWVTTFDDVGATREGYSLGRSQGRGKQKRTVAKTFESKQAAETYLDKLYARELKAGRIPAAPEKMNVPSWVDKEGKTRPALGEVEILPQTAQDKEDGFRRFRPVGENKQFPRGGTIEEAWYQSAKQATGASVAPTFDTLAQKMAEVSPNAADGALTSIRDLRQAMRAELPTKEAFDQFLLQQAREDKIALHHHDYPSSLTDAERAEMVRDEQSNYYIGAALREPAAKANRPAKSTEQQLAAVDEELAAGAITEKAAATMKERIRAGAKPKFVADAEARLADYKSGRQLGGGQQLLDQAIVSGYKVYRAGMDFAQWSAAVVKDAGEAVKPHLRRAWTRIKAAAETHGPPLLAVRSISAGHLPEFLAKGDDSGISIGVTTPEKIAGLDIYGDVFLIAKPELLNKQATTYMADAMTSSRNVAMGEGSLPDQGHERYRELYWNPEPMLDPDHTWMWLGGSEYQAAKVASRKAKTRLQAKGQKEDLQALTQKQEALSQAVTGMAKLLIPPRNENSLNIQSYWETKKAVLRSLLPLVYQERALKGSEQTVLKAIVRHSLNAKDRRGIQLRPGVTEKEALAATRNILEAADAYREAIRDTPEGYLETKIHRPVTAEDFALAVVPAGTPAKVIEELKARGLEVQTYKSKNELATLVQDSKAELPQSRREWVGYKPDLQEKSSFQEFLRDEGGSASLGLGIEKIFDNLRAGRRKIPPKTIPADFNAQAWIRKAAENLAKQTLSDADRAKVADPNTTTAEKAKIYAAAKIDPAQQAAFQTAMGEAFAALSANDYNGFQDAANRLKAISDAPATNWEKASAIRKAAMLSRPVSHLRNLIGNTGFKVLEAVARIPGGGLADPLMGLATNRRALQGMNVIDGAQSIYESATGGIEAARDAMKGRSSEDIARALQTKEVNFNNKTVDKAVKFVFRSLGAEDQIFYVGAYDRAIREAAKLQARNEARQGIIKRADLKARQDALLAAPTPQMEIDAALAAETAVFRNENALSSAIGRVREGASDKANFALDLVLPFDRTPTNVVLRALEYSPLGVARGAVKGVAGAGRAIAARRAAKKAGTPSKADVQAAIDKAFTPAQQRSAAQLLGRGTVGSGLLALGYALAAKGLMTGFYDDEDYKGEAMKRATGAQPLAIQIGGRWYGLNGVGPIGMALGMGATIHDESKKKGGDMLGASAKAAKEQAMEAPLLSSLKDLSKDVERVSKDRANAGKLVGNLASSFVPGVLNDLGQSIPYVRDPFEREVKDDPKKVKGFRRAVREGAGQVGAKIPGVRRMLPVKKDITGKPVASRPLAPIDPFSSRPATGPLPQRRR